MDKLVVISGDGVTQEFPLEKKHTKLGRDQSHDICLRDKSVSRLHACINQIYTEYFLEDQKSTNGTLLNGVEIRKHILKNGDEITVGKYKLQFQASEKGSEADDLDKTMVIRPVAEEPVTPTTQTEIRPASLSKDQAKIRFLSGLDQGEVKVLDRSFFTIGKPGGDLVLINRRHTGYFLLKMGGDNAPTVNGAAVKVGGIELKDGDQIRLGELDLEFIH